MDARGAGGDLFHDGFAKETADPDVVAATMTVFRKISIELRNFGSSDASAVSAV